MKSWGLERLRQYLAEPGAQILGARLAPGSLPGAPLFGGVTMCKFNLGLCNAACFSNINNKTGGPAP